MSSAAPSRRPASTTRRSSARAGCGRCTRRRCGRRPDSECCRGGRRRAGGALLYEGGHDRARALAAQARAAGVEILARAPALGFFDGLVPVWQGDTLHQVRAARTVVATGVIEQPLVFADNDLPGIWLAGGAHRLAALYGVRPGAAAVIATTGDRGLVAALALREA